MPVPQITITPAGFAALVNDEHTGTKVVKITHIGLTATHFDVNAVGAALPGEHKRLTTFGGKAVAADTLHLNIRDDGPDTYTMRGFGLYLQDGTLFAVYSQATPIMEKAAAATLLLATDIRFSKITATSIEVGDVDFINPPATTTQVGVVRFSTDQEADAGSDQTTALTPRGLFRYVNARFGADAPSALVKTLLSAATAAIFRTALGIKSAALRDEGHNNGLNADKLDGEHGAYYLDFRNSTNLPTSWNPIAHTHTIGQVDGLGDALNAKANLSGAAFVGEVSASKVTSRSNHFYGGQTHAVLNPSAVGGVCMLRPDGASSSTGELVVATAAITWDGRGIWHEGTFNPATKASLTGATFTGSVATTGVIGLDVTRTKGRLLIRDNDAGYVSIDAVLPDNSSFGPLHARGMSFNFNGQPVWHGGNFNPDWKVNKGGDEMSGVLSFRGGGVAPRRAKLFHNANETIDYGAKFMLDSSDSTTDLGCVTIIPVGANGYQSQILLQLKSGDFFNAPVVNVVTVRANGIDVLGTISPSGGYDFGSSRKLKDIEGPQPYGLAEVERMELAAGHYKPEYNNDGRRRLFFVAEQLAELVPESVDMEGVEFKGERVASIKLDQLLPVIARAIQELAAEVRALQVGR